MRRSYITHDSCLTPKLDPKLFNVNLNSTIIESAASICSYYRIALTYTAPQEIIL